MHPKGAFPSHAVSGLGGDEETRLHHLRIRAAGTGSPCPFSPAVGPVALARTRAQLDQSAHKAAGARIPALLGLITVTIASGTRN
jgi:hypothetical protein